MADDKYTSYFAAVYDRIMSEVPYDFWFSYLKELLAYYQIKPVKILELACGTGNMSMRLAKLNDCEKLLATDLSAEMLEKAASKVNDKQKNIIFQQADMRKIIRPEKFDLVVSFFDSINYLLTTEELAQTFSNVYQLLAKEGFFIFDMNSMQQLLNIEEGTMVFEEDNFSVYWEDLVDQSSKRWQVNLKICLEESGKLNCYQELHEEQGYQIEVIEKLLYQAGFQAVKVFKAFTFHQGDDNYGNRLYFIATPESKNLETDYSFFKKVFVKLRTDLRLFWQKIT